MGYKKNWDVRDVQIAISKCSAELKSPYNDGFTQWACKKDLYELYFYLQDIIDNSPKFTHLEEEYLKTKAQEILLAKLKDNYALR